MGKEIVIDVRGLYFGYLKEPHFAKPLLPSTPG